MSGVARQFAVGAGRVVADQAVHVLLDVEIETAVFPAVTRMTCHAVLLVRNRRSAVVVDDILLATHLSGLGIDGLPCPVLGVLHLLGGFGVAGQASFASLAGRS